MKMSDLDTKMRKGELFHSLTVPPQLRTIFRIDGRSFSNLTLSEGFDKPFDFRFSMLMQNTAVVLLKEFNGSYVYTESDEISLLLPRDWDLFDREVEKMVSLTASLASATFSLELGKPVMFDSRVWVGSDEDVVDYFAWRQADAWRCCLNGYAYWTLRNEGQSARAATSTLNNMSATDKHDLLFHRGINANDFPEWQKRGTGMVWTQQFYSGFNPITNQFVGTTRRQIFVNNTLPKSSEYREFIKGML